MSKKRVEGSVGALWIGVSKKFCKYFKGKIYETDVVIFQKNTVYSMDILDSRNLKNKLGLLTRKVLPDGELVFDGHFQDKPIFGSLINRKLNKHSPDIILFPKTMKSPSSKPEIIAPAKQKVFRKKRKQALLEDFLNKKQAELEDKIRQKQIALDTPKPEYTPEPRAPKRLRLTHTIGGKTTL